ncbi:hypothetical protein [Phocaeicola sp.]
MEKLRKEQIDWKRYRQHLAGSLSNERIRALGHHGGCNLHIENYNKLEKELELLDSLDYDAVLDSYGDVPECFDDFLLNPKTDMKEVANSFKERAMSLRSGLINAIINLLKDYNLTEIKLSKQPDKQPWVVWFDNRSCGYDSRVRKVFLEDGGIAIEVYDEDCCCSQTLTSKNADLACTNIDWLCDILDCINHTLHLPDSAGTALIAGQTVKWSYDEPGLSELPEDNIEEIKSRLNKGIPKGELCCYDDYGVEFNGIWEIIRDNL